MSKLMYGLVTAVLNKSERRRLNGFQARCLRRILKVPSAYVNRISNARLLSMAQDRLLSSTLEKHQMILMGKLALRPSDDVVRSSIFMPDGINLKRVVGSLKRGRPRIRWAHQVHNLCLNVAGSLEALSHYWNHESSSFEDWKRFIKMGRSR